MCFSLNILGYAILQFYLQLFYKMYSYQHHQILNEMLVNDTEKLGLGFRPQT